MRSPCGKVAGYTRRRHGSRRGGGGTAPSTRPILGDWDWELMNERQSTRRGKQNIALHADLPDKEFCCATITSNGDIIILITSLQINTIKFSMIIVSFVGQCYNQLVYLTLCCIE